MNSPGKFASSVLSWSLTINLRATIIVAKALCLIFKLSLAKNTCLFTDGNSFSLSLSLSLSLLIGSASLDAYVLNNYKAGSRNPQKCIETNTPWSIYFQ